MTEELRELGFKAGQRRIGRLMRENGIVATRTRKYQVPTDSNHKLAVAPNLLDRDFSATAPNQEYSSYRPWKTVTRPRKLRMLALSTPHNPVIPRQSANTLTAL